MVAKRRKRGLILLGAVSVFLNLPTSGYSQSFLNPEQLSEINGLAYLGPGETGTIETAHAQVGMEHVELPAMAHPFATHDALVLARLNAPATRVDRSPVLAEIYFDAKRYFLKREAAQIIVESAKLLAQDHTRKLQIEAICDKRGTAAYSLALGNLRAYAVSRYLHNLGISSSQISTTSFGAHPHRCQASSPDCWQDTLRMDHAFNLLAMNQPQEGCLTRLRLTMDISDQPTPKHTTRQLFLQRIHLAESR